MFEITFLNSEGVKKQLFFPAPIPTQSKSLALNEYRKATFSIKSNVSKNILLVLLKCLMIFDASFSCLDIFR